MGGSADAAASDGTAGSAGTIEVAVDDSPSAGNHAHLGVGSNQVYAVDGIAGAPARLEALGLALLRLHIHAVGGNLPTAASKIQVCTEPADTSCNRVPWSFANLDYLVGDALTAGATPLMNIALPPPWQWTVTNATSTPKPTAHVSDADDPQHPFAMFASYMRSLVEYYNLGQTTVTEQDGTSRTLVNPHGKAYRVTWWELLNEPALSSPANPYQPAGPYPFSPTFTPQEYVAMWNATTAAMIAADPTVKIAGPAMPYAQTPSPAGGTDYIPLLLQQSRKPDAVSFHGYAWADNEITDADAFGGNEGVPTQKGLAGVLSDLHRVQAWTQAAGVPALPIWLDEFGFNGFGTLDPHHRPRGVFAAAFTAVAFARLSGETALAQLDEFSFALQTYPDLSLLDFGADGRPILLYWLYRALGHSFPVGGTVLPVQNAEGAFSLTSPGVAAFAMRANNSSSVSVLLANGTVAHPTDKGGAGVRRTVHLRVSGEAFTKVSVQHIDGSTDLDAGPSTTTLPSGSDATVDLPGYGVAIVTFVP